MRRFFVALLFGTLLLTVVAQPATAREGTHDRKTSEKHRILRLNGVVTAVSVDAMTVRALRGERTATFALGAKTRFAPHKLVPNASALRVGDAVSVLAVRAGEAMTARRVEVHLQRYRGTVTSFDDGSISVHWVKADATAKAWLKANDDPQPVTAAITDATTVRRKGDGPVKIDDAVELRARPAPGDASKLDAVTVSTRAQKHASPEPSASPSTD